MIRNIWAVGRNYADHAKEMGQSQTLTEPMIFLKAGSCAVEVPDRVVLPSWTKEIHFETEMAVLLGTDLAPVAVAIALDLTERSAQSEAKAKGHPWTLAKSFQRACPLGNFARLENREVLSHLSFELRINGEVKQQGHTSEMIFSTLEIIDYLRQRFPVCEGDLLLTGTPAGVGPLRPGDKVEADLGDLSRLKFEVAGV